MTDRADIPYTKEWWGFPENKSMDAKETHKLIYLAGSMRNRAGVIEMALRLQARGYRVFCDWLAPGEETDSKWQQFAQAMGQSYLDALHSPHAMNVYEFDRKWLDRAAALVVVGAPGKSAMAEIGYMTGRGKNSVVYLTEEPDRWDVMLNFASYIAERTDDVLSYLEAVL